MKPVKSNHRPLRYQEEKIALAGVPFAVPKTDPITMHTVMHFLVQQYMSRENMKEGKIRENQSLASDADVFADIMEAKGPESENGGRGAKWRKPLHLYMEIN